MSKLNELLKEIKEMNETENFASDKKESSVIDHKNWRDIIKKSQYLSSASLPYKLPKRQIINGNYFINGNENSFSTSNRISIP